MVTAYGQQEHLHRLCSTLRRLDPTALITVQYDESNERLDRRNLPSDVDVFVAPHAITWGDSSYVDALAMSFDRSLECSWDYVVLVSGQDYPIKPAAELHERLEGTAGILSS